MHFFQFAPSDHGRDSATPYGVDGSHPWSLPGVECADCGQIWTTTAVCYPTVDLSALDSANRYVSPGVVPWEQFHEWRAPIQSFLPVGAFLPPGTAFGPLAGRLVGRPSAFAWMGRLVLLIRPEAFTALKQRGVRLPPSVLISLRVKGSRSEAFYELQIEPRARLARESFDESRASKCGTCGRIDAPLVQVKLESESMPNDVDLVRPQNFPGLILASERFADAIAAEELRGGEIRPLSDYV